MHPILFLSAWRLYIDVFLSPSFLFLNDCKHVIKCMYLHDFMKITHWLLCFSWVANLKLSQSDLLTVKDLLASASNSEKKKKIDRHLNFPKKNSWQKPVHAMPHLTVKCSSWWNSNEQKIPSSSSKTASLKMGSPRQQNHEAKHLGLQLPDQESSTIQFTGQSHHEVGAVGGNNSQSQCISSESGIYSVDSVSLFHIFCITLVRCRLLQWS